MNVVENEEELYSGPIDRPEPTAEQLRAEREQSNRDHDLAWQELWAGHLDQYVGKWVAFYGGEMLGAERNPHPLRSRLAKERGVFVSQIIVIYVDPNGLW